MLVPAVIFVACFGTGAAAAAHWLPELDTGAIGGIAFFLVCGLAAAALGVVGMHVYTLVNQLENLHGGPGYGRGEIVAAVLRNIAFESGSLAALAGIVYLLAPQLDRSRPTRSLTPAETEAAE